MARVTKNRYMPPHDVRDLCVRFLRKHYAPASSFERIINSAIGNGQYYGLINGEAPFWIGSGDGLIRDFLQAIERQKKLKHSDIGWTIFLLKFTAKNQEKLLTKGGTK
jgi:hypothetical protein